MKTILLIIEREFLTRVKKKSFLIMTLLTPLLFAGAIFAYIAIFTAKDSEEQKVTIIDQTGLIDGRLENTNTVKFTFDNTASVTNLKEQFLETGEHTIVLHIGELNSQNNPADVTLYSDRQVNMDVQNYVRSSIEKLIEEKKLKGYDIEDLDKILAAVKTNISIKTIKWDKEGKESVTNNLALMVLSYLSAFLIYMFIFMFGSMVMRGVIEEKSNRIIEVIISSVRPFQLMIGKIVGIAAVGLLQFILWVVITIGLLFAAQKMFLGDVQQTATEMTAVTGVDTSVVKGAAANSEMLTQISQIIDGIPVATILICFLLYFLLGYLLYASMFAAIGSAVENETETQQLIMPVTIPLIIGFLMMMHTFQYPNSTMSFWGSMIPLTSPMVMLARVPFGVPIWQLELSLGLLVATFVVFTWLSGKIYRVGILMYGKKATFKELWKWMWYKS
ncbi:MAG: ABC transporter permease [Prevotellaceae bacterium]|jgi:ABC-2 type transport system permease protein|nr:ABC transporter permease [Prevotellaceae bacterium]